MSEGQREVLMGLVRRKTRDFEELRGQFQELKRQEEESHKEIEKLNQRSGKEE